MAFDKFTELPTETPVAVVVPPVTDEKVIVPSEVKAVPLLKVVTPDKTEAVKLPPVMGTVVDCAKLGIAEIAPTLIALKREKNRVVGFMFLVI